MNINRYNQLLLAVLGSLAVLFLIIAIINFVVETTRYSYDDDDPGILSEEKIEELQKENKREQVISYELPRLVDSLNSIYAIPVSYTNLNEEENIDGILNAMASSDSYSKTDKRYSSVFFGTFNNIVLFDAEEGTSNRLFNHRANFDKIDTQYFENDIIMLIQTSDKDTYRDGVINMRDLQNLYIYSFANKKLKEIKMEGHTVYNYNFLNETKDLLIQFGVDRNKDGQYNDYKEPAIVKRYLFEKSKLIDLVDPKTNSELQKMLEGTPF